MGRRPRLTGRKLRAEGKLGSSINPLGNRFQGLEKLASKEVWTNVWKILETRPDAFVRDVHGSDASGPTSGGREDCYPGELLKNCEDTLIEGLQGQGCHVGRDGQVLFAGSGDVLGTSPGRGRSRGRQGEEGRALKTKGGCLVELKENCLEGLEVPVAIGTLRQRRFP
jgi:hypothetical protein